MSIINKMLQDLDQRSGRRGGETMAGNAIRSIKPESPWRLGRNIVLAIIGLGGVSLAGAWWLQQRNHEIESRVIVPAPPVPVLAHNPPPAASQVALASPAPVVAVAASAVSAKAPVATTPRTVAALAAPPPVPAASSSSTPDKVVPPALPEAIAMSPKAADGKTYTARQSSANLLGEAVMLDRQGHQEEAKVLLQRALAANPLDVQARQMLSQLQLETGQVEKAGALLAEGQRLFPEQSNFTLMLARLKTDAGDISGAIQLLEAGRGSARSEPEYQAFLAALLLRVQRYDEAVEHYLVALRSDPANTNWLVGVGVAFEGVGKHADAAEAYRRADGMANVTPEMANFLSERLARLGR